MKALRIRRGFAANTWWATVATGVACSVVGLVWSFVPPALGATGSPESGQRLGALFQAGDLSTAAGRYDFVVLNEWNHEWIAHLKAVRPDVRVLLYKNTFFLREDDNASTVGGFSGVDGIHARHPEWFLRARSGKLITFQYYEGIDFYAMDWGNEEWRAYWAERALDRAVELGFDGVFLDDVYARKYGVLGRSLAGYDDDLDLQAAARGFLESVHRRAEDVDPDLLVVANVVDHLSFPGLFADWLTVSDGLMDEQFAHTGQHDRVGFKSLGDGWERQLEEVAAAERARAPSVFVSHGESGDEDTMLYGYATYLLAAGGSTVYVHVHDGSMNEPSWYPVWRRDLGVPLGPYRARRDGLYHRTFSRGLVAVNPRADISLTLETWGYVDRVGRPVASVGLRPHEAVLLYRRTDLRRHLFQEPVPRPGPDGPVAW